MNRRKFLLQSVQASALISCYVPTTGALSAVFVSNKKLLSLPHFLDTLIPEDITPSASQLGLHQTLIEHARNIENYTELLELGCDWLDRQAQSMFNHAFRDTTEQEAIAIVAVAEKSSNTTLQNLFFTRIKSDAFIFYYSHPTSWKTLGFNAPPQPLGYPDFTLPLEIKS